MLLVCCSIHDSALKAYTRPFYVPALGAAVRAFSDMCNDPQSDFFKHPSDYILYELGEFDDSTALYKPLEAPRIVSRGIDLISPPSKKKVS